MANFTRWNKSYIHDKNLNFLFIIYKLVFNVAWYKDLKGQPEIYYRHLSFFNTKVLLFILSINKASFDSTYLWRHISLMTLCNIGILHYSTHWSRMWQRCKTKKSAKPSYLVPNYSFHSKKMHTHTSWFHSQTKKVQASETTVELQRKLMKKAEVIQKLIFFTSEISLDIFH